MVTKIPDSAAFFQCLWLTGLLLVCSSGVAAKDSWIEVRSPHFKVVSNAGESQARKIADQFEQFREVFHSFFPKLRVDPGTPLIIFAVKNEDTLKLLLPTFWEAKGRMHPTGVFMPGETRHYVALRTDIETENPYQVVYHEYTHAIMNLNFQRLPIWLGEGLAEYFGNSTIRDKDVAIGKIASYHLEVLQTSRLIPIDVLIQVDASSPYYNEQNRASVFYAESWAIVHYLEMDPDARERKLLSTFLASWAATGDQVEAAKQAFGDLTKFSHAMEAYSRRTAFYVNHVQTSVQGAAKTYSSRGLSPGEVAAEKALFYIHTRRAQEARAFTDEALQLEPNAALAHEASGLIAYQGGEYAKAEAEFARSIELSPTSYVSYFFEAQARLHGGNTQPEELPEIHNCLEKALALNPQFAPAYATLSNFYSMHARTLEKALAMARKAIELEPGNLNYASNYGLVLLNMGKVEAAKTLSSKISAAAQTPQEKELAAWLANAIAARESEHALQRSTRNNPVMEDKSIQTADDRNDPPANASKTEAPAQTPTAATPRPTVTGPDYRLEGRVVAAECPTNGGVTATLSINSVLMKFHAADLKTVGVTSAENLAFDNKPPCANWKGRRARVTFHSVPAGEFDGELSALYFF